LKSASCHKTDLGLYKIFFTNSSVTNSHQSRANYRSQQPPLKHLSELIFLTLVHPDVQTSQDHWECRPCMCLQF